jgi:hypothetical protein
MVAMRDRYHDLNRAEVVQIVVVACDTVCLGVVKEPADNEANAMVGTWLVQVDPMLGPTTDEVDLINVGTLPDGDRLLAIHCYCLLPLVWHSLHLSLLTRLS